MPFITRVRKASHGLAKIIYDFTFLMQRQNFLSKPSFCRSCRESFAWAPTFYNMFTEDNIGKLSKQTEQIYRYTTALSILYHYLGFL